MTPLGRLRKAIDEMGGIKEMCLDIDPRAALVEAVLELDARLKCVEPCPSPQSGAGMHFFDAAGRECRLCGVRRVTA